MFNIHNDKSCRERLADNPWIAASWVKTGAPSDVATVRRKVRWTSETCWYMATRVFLLLCEISVKKKHQHQHHVILLITHHVCFIWDFKLRESRLVGCWWMESACGVHCWSQNYEIWHLSVVMCVISHIFLIGWDFKNLSDLACNQTE